MRDAMNMTLEDLHSYNNKGETVAAETVCALDDLADSVAVLKACQDRISQLKEVMKEHRALIEEKMGDQETGTVDGKPVITWKTYKQTRLNQKYLALNFAGVFDVCKETTETRRMEIL